MRMNGLKKLSTNSQKKLEECNMAYELRTSIVDLAKKRGCNLLMKVKFPLNTST